MIIVIILIICIEITIIKRNKFIYFEYINKSIWLNYKKLYYTSNIYIILIFIFIIRIYLLNKNYNLFKLKIYI